ncbi:histone deacetylase HDT1-like isoform X1 [Miscanthus floridulus]|uniref:histone deacetylase HDT1-like isoform X1 n=1 Tax=Miscanthus floridulus TaxID=154761 RepID=UPI00345AE278
MTFWGVDVKPGEPYIYQPSPGRRFRITQALLGSYADVGWSMLECNVGNMNPVKICALNPTNHICDLEIEYEERESVFLSVSGSSSIHLSGRIYNHSASDDQAHTSNKLTSKTETPACLKRKHQGNEANGNKEPSLKEPNVTKADGKNDASSKEPLISEAGGKNVASPKQPIVGEDDYSDEHLPIPVAYEKRMATRKRTKYRTPGIGKVLSGQNNDYKII